MSNLIKSFQTTKAKPFVFDANKNDIIIKINEQLQQAPKENTVTGETENFQSGITAEEIPDDTKKLDADASSADIEDAHEAALIVNEAYDEADKIRQQAQAEAEDIKAQSQAVGMEQGRKEGYAQAEQEIAQMKEEMQKETQAYKEQLLQQYNQELDALEPKFTEVLCDLLNRLTGVVVEEHQEVLLYLINNAMKELDNAHSFVISVSEADYEAISKNKEEIYGYLNPGISIEIFQDAKLQKNECKIETEGGIVDLSLSVQLSKMVECLKMLNA